MTMTCPKCGHQRTDADDPAIPDAQCPTCGIFYFKYLNQKSDRPRAQAPPEKPQPPNQEPAPPKIDIPKPVPTETQALLHLTELAQHKTNHVLHLLLSIITFGAWITVWMIVYAVNTSERNRIHKKYGFKTESNKMAIYLILNVLIVSFIFMKACAHQ